MQAILEITDPNKSRLNNKLAIRTHHHTITLFSLLIGLQFSMLTSKDYQPTARPSTHPSVCLLNIVDSLIRHYSNTPPPPFIFPSSISATQHFSKSEGKNHLLHTTQKTQFRMIFREIGWVWVCV